jgi:hypothetical protein
MVTTRCPYKPDAAGAMTRIHDNHRLSGVAFEPPAESPTSSGRRRPARSLVEPAYCCSTA